MGAPLDPIAALVQIEPSRGHSGETAAPSAAVRIAPGEIDRFLENAKPGEALEYHRGFLALDRGPGSRLGPIAGAELDRLAAVMLEMAEADRVHLVQRRHGVHDYSYLAVASRNVSRGLPGRLTRETSP
jgi:hypothetical protein